MPQYSTGGKVPQYTVSLVSYGGEKCPIISSLVTGKCPVIVCSNTFARFGDFSLGAFDVVFSLGARLACRLLGCSLGSHIALGTEDIGYGGNGHVYDGDRIGTEMNTVIRSLLVRYWGIHRVYGIKRAGIRGRGKKYMRTSCAKKEWSDIARVVGLAHNLFISSCCLSSFHTLVICQKILSHNCVVRGHTLYKHVLSFESFNPIIPTITVSRVVLLHCLK